MGPRFVLAGIGVNVAQAPEDFPPGLRDRSTSLASAAERPIHKDRLLRLLCESLETWYDSSNFADRGQDRSRLSGGKNAVATLCKSRFPLKTGGAAIKGTFIGLDAFGGLICEDGGRRTAHYSADVQVLECG